MIDQVVGDGANLFILIVAILFGFVNALAFVDMKKEEKQAEKDH